MDSIDAVEPALSLPEVDPERPSPARIYDFWLGGSQNFEAGREAGQRAAEAMPSLPCGAKANRLLLQHVVEDLVSVRGITQFLDLGSGVPTVGNVHEIAQATEPNATVVYIDIDPVAIAHARALLAENATAHAALADLREPECRTGPSVGARGDRLEQAGRRAAVLGAALHPRRQPARGHHQRIYGAVRARQLLGVVTRRAG